MTTAIDTAAAPKLFAVAHLPGTKKPYVVRTTEAEYAFARKVGSSKKIMELIEAGYKLDQTGQTRPIIPAEGKHVVYDPETRDYMLYLDGQFVGAARTETEANVTLDTLVDEIARHTRATTADMEADAAEMRQEAESLTTGIHLDGETSYRTHATAAERDEYLRYNPSAWVLVEPTEPVTGICLDCQDRAAIDARARHSTPVVSAPPRTIDELRGEFDAVTDAILGVKRGTDAWDRLHRMRLDIIAELEAARRAQDPAPADTGNPIELDEVEYPASTGPQPVEDLPAANRTPTIRVTDPSHPYYGYIISQTRIDGPAHIGYRDGGVWGSLHVSQCEEVATCSSCGDPSDGICPACRESGEPAGTIDDLNLPDHITTLLVGTSDPRCKVCGSPAEVSAGDGLYCKTCWHGPDDPDDEPADEDETPQGDPADEDPYAPVPVSRPGGDRQGPNYAALAEPVEALTKECRACGRAGCPGVVSIQRCTAIRAALMGTPTANDYRTGDTVIVVAERELHDPCAELRRELDETRALLRQALEELEHYHREAQDRADERADDYARRHGDKPSFQAAIDASMSYEVSELPLLARIRAALEDDQEYESTRRVNGPFAALRDMTYTACPCGCGAKEICEAQAARVKAHDDAIPF